MSIGVRQVQVTFDCAEPVRMARFWCDVLGYVEAPDNDASSAACSDPTGIGPRLYFQRVPEGKTGKNRVHLDVRAGTGLTGDERMMRLQTESTRLTALGAMQVQLLPADQDNECCIVMQDMEGNEFCLD